MSAVLPLPPAPRQILTDPAVAKAYEQMTPGAAKKLLNLYRLEDLFSFVLGLLALSGNLVVQMTGKLVTGLLISMVILGATGFLIYGTKAATVRAVSGLVIQLLRSLCGK